MGFAFRLASVYAGLFGAIGVQLPFMPVWLAAKGLEEGAIGALLALATATRVAVVPFGARAADRLGRPREAIVAAAGCCALAMLALAGAQSTGAIFALYALAAACAATALPLTESYALRGLAERGRPYGPVRLWGSAAFIGGTLTTGTLLVWVPAIHVIWLLIAVYGFAALCATRLLPLSANDPVAGERPSTWSLLRGRTMLAVVAASALVQGSHALLYVFGSLQWSAAGLSGLSIGLLWSIGVVAEIVLFAASGRFPPSVGPHMLMALGVVGAVTRWGLMAVDPPGAFLPVLQCLHALSFGATHLGAVQLVARLAPPNLSATAQGMLATGNGVAMAGAMAVSGLLNAQFGTGAYAAMAMMALAAGGVLVLARDGDDAWKD